MFLTTCSFLFLFRRDGVSITCSEPKPIRRKTAGDNFKFSPSLFQHRNFAAFDVISINKLNFDYCQLEMLIRLQLIDIKFLKEFEKILSSNQWLTSKVSWIAFYYQELIFCRS